MVISSFISSILVLALGIWAYMKLESSMNIVAEKQLLIEPSKFSYKMWKDMPVTMYQSFTFFNLTNWNQVKSIGQKPRFVEVGPYVYKTIWTKSDINFLDEERLVSFAEKKQWIFQPHLSKGFEDDQIWTINTPLMTALALIQNAPVITRNIVSVILDGLGEGAFIKRSIRSLLFEGYSDLIVSVGPLFDRRFANFNGKFAYLYNKNDSVDGVWTVSTGTEDLATLNKITRFQSNIVNMTSFSTGQLPQGLNEVKPECASAWSLDQSSNGQLFSPFNRDLEQVKLEQQLQQQLKTRAARADLQSAATAISPVLSSPPQLPPTPKRFFSRSTTTTTTTTNHDLINRDHQYNQQDLVQNPFINQRSLDVETARSSQSSLSQSGSASSSSSQQIDKFQLKDLGKFIFYPDLCRPIHLLPSKQEVFTSNGIKASRYFIDPRVFMNSTQIPSNRCYEMNPRPPLANTLAATINSVTGANVAMPNLVTGASSPFAMFSPPGIHHNSENGGGLFERSNHPTTSFFNNALHSLGVTQDQQTSSTNTAPVSRLGRVRQLFSNIVSQRMSASPGSLLPSLAAGPAAMLIGNHFPTPAAATATNSNPPIPNVEDQSGLMNTPIGSGSRHNPLFLESRHAGPVDRLASGPKHPLPVQAPPPAGGSDRWITQFRFKWPRGVFSIGQCQLGAPIYASLPHFLDADDYYLEQVDGLKPNRSLHEFYIDVESTLHSIPVGAKARLQLNVATPELRFRNIPNAMIPVLWQEVTFEIDKPIATMLYWSFTMSSTIYKLISILLLALGVILMVASFVGGFKQRARRSKVIAPNDHHHHHPHTHRRQQVTGRDSSPQGHREGQRSSWMPHMIHNHNYPTSASTRHFAGSTNQVAQKNDSSHDALDEIRHGAAINHAFSSCTEFHDRSSESGQHQQQHQSCSSTGRQNSSSNNSSGSPKQPSSRASSHCELVSSLGTTVNCAGCLLACLRHSPANSNHQIHDHLTATSDNSLVIQQVTTSDIDKATLSSRDSNSVDSCSSIYTQRSRAFK